MCTFAAHDDTSEQGRDGENPTRGANACRHCSQPAHHDRWLADYRHDDPSVPDCFLIHGDG
ncbi:hypothetical protein U2F26_29310 [Micromonospora sp. 4G57]|uniref:Uncharacterized protein n=1 Tax=Micromonospora sicca TaxID=2202420 RepID=A0ABU5JLQ4_9ACTN|nr:MULTISPECIES: hypothetical protein [unclassified Micromonospora]MDZ5446776.1 hypothetical protein [Micromonospora sp. 4G57]MDZ5493511.1 hypothetical protein [Micromonospora sp. 4G53]